MIRLFAAFLIWASVGHASPAQVEILPGWRTEAGTHMAGLRIRLAPGWKTYWRSPGDAGIPPSFDWSGSDNLGAMTVHWPAPEVFDPQQMRILAYRGDVVLPIEFSVPDGANPAQLRGQIMIGICEHICMPMALEVQATLPSGGARDPKIVAALLNRTKPGPGAMGCELAPVKGGIGVSLRVPAQPGDHAAIEAGRGIWVSQPTVQRQGQELVVQATADATMLARGDVRLTLISGGGAVEYRGCD